jgi:lysophospholipase L1-like esterase
VTVTIGGNDVKFTEFATACVVPLSSCSIGSTAYNDSKAEIDNNLAAKLTSTYADILTRASTANIYVLGYPQVAPIKTATDPDDPRCTYLSGGSGWGDAIGARDIVTRLNTKIAATVAAMGNTRLHYIDVNATGSPFVGHTVCADPGESYFNNIDTIVAGKIFVFHPNARGQQAYADLVASALVP